MGVYWDPALNKVRGEEAILTIHTHQLKLSSFQRMKKL